MPDNFIICHFNIPAAVPFANCNTLIHVIGGSINFVVPTTSALFFFRVKAVYCNDRVIVILFGFMWLVLSGLCFLIPFSPRAAYIGTTRAGICVVTRIEQFASIPLITHFVFDTLVFLAISARIVSFSIVGDTFGERMRSFFRGDGLSCLSRSLLYGGQVYYV
jgi:hypothetical protein